MAITLQESYELGVNSNFINLIGQAMATVALDVLYEDPATLGDGEYELRKVFADNVLRDVPRAARLSSPTFATKSIETDPFAITDQQYLTTVRNEWSAISGYNPLYTPA